MKMIRKIFVVASIALLSGCGMLFDKDNTPPPTPLQKFRPEVWPRLLWSRSIGEGQSKHDNLKFVPAYDNGMIFTADERGNVTSVDATTGKINWQNHIPLYAASGPGAGEGLVVVGGRDGQVIALEQLTGRIVWEAHKSSEILAPATIQNDVVVAKSIDGEVSAFNASDGHLLWHYHHQEPNLILRSASTPKISRGSVIVGFASGNLAKLTLNAGNLLWQETIAIPEGSFSIQRMVDIDADPTIFGNHIIVATYQGTPPSLTMTDTEEHIGSLSYEGKVASVDFSSGHKEWEKDISSYTGLTVDQRHVYISETSSRLFALTTYNGTMDWSTSALVARNITGPVLMNPYIVVGDGEGYLHWFNQNDGHLAARVKTGSSPILATPIVKNNILYVLTKDGHLMAYTLSAL